LHRSAAEERGKKKKGPFKPKLKKKGETTSLCQCAKRKMKTNERKGVGGERSAARELIREKKASFSACTAIKGFLRFRRGAGKKKGTKSRQPKNTQKGRGRGLLPNACEGELKS